MEEANIELIYFDLLRNANSELNFISDFWSAIADIELAAIVMGN
jgi:hypothetical protein